VKIPELKIGNLKAEVPVIQGGMAIRVSTHSLASSVANCGGVGVIAGSGMETDELRNEIRTARKNITNPNGLLGVNIMYAASEFNTLVNVCIEERVDVIISGAGFCRSIFKTCQDSNINYIPIVSSPRLAILSKKLGATAIIVESGEAGGHLGTNKTIRELIPEIKAAIDEVESPLVEYDEIPLIAAGGVTNGHDIVEMLRLGASGVQMATRFVLTHECSVSDTFKNVLLNATEDDIILINSPVSLPARAIKTPFSEKILNKTVERPAVCEKCLKHCTHEFCIINALNRSRNGDYENGLFFSGENIGKYNDILSVAEIFNNLKSEMLEAISEKVNIK
jgi:NAD(P)H-dependent flavin oxidoreductase YrpB (nitropropane dioxygenase family)